MLLKIWKQSSYRAFSKSSFLKNSNKPKPVEQNPVEQSPTNFNQSDFGATAIPSNWERRVLVWAGKYKSLDEVPNRISYDTMNKAKSVLRIRISNYMMIATLLCCVAVVYMGKKKAKEGDSLMKRMQEREAKIKAQSQV